MFWHALIAVGFAACFAQLGAQSVWVGVMSLTLKGLLVVLAAIVVGFVIHIVRQGHFGSGD